MRKDEGGEGCWSVRGIEECIQQCHDEDTGLLVRSGRYPARRAWTVEDLQ